MRPATLTSMNVDPEIARRLLHNRDVRTAHGWGDVRDLQGALSVTSDAPIPGLNSLHGFNVRERELDALLDVGFALLRAFDRDPAVEVTPLDRPKTLRRHLARRRLVCAVQGSWMVHDPAAPPIARNPDVEVRLGGPDDIRAFAAIVGGSEPWARRLCAASAVNAMQQPGNYYYLGCLDGMPVSTLHMLIDGAAAGIYAVNTLRAHRRKGISSTVMARAIADARAAGCDLIGLGCEANGYAERLYARQGFTRVFTSEMWTLPAAE